MTMTNFLQRMIWRNGDNDRQNVTIAEDRCFADFETKMKTVDGSDSLETRSQSATNISGITGGPRRPSTLKLFGNSKKLLTNKTSCGSSESLKGSKTPTTQLVEEVVREFEENYKSPTKSSSFKKSKNFVRRLVAALERKQRDNETDEVFSTRYNSTPIYAYEKSGTLRKSNNSVNRKNNKNEMNDCSECTATDITDEAINLNERKNALVNKTSPKIVGAFLKKPIEIEQTSVYWIPITGKKLPRKKSFKKLLAKLTGKNGGKISNMKTKQVIFASQANLIEEIHDSGYDERSLSSRTSSLTSFAENLMYHDNDYVDKAYKDCDFSTFVTSSPLKKVGASQRQLVDNTKCLKKMFNVKETEDPDVKKIQEDSGYISSHSIVDESNIPKKNLVATRVKEISYQLSKLPKHPFARSEPRLYNNYNYESPLNGEIVILRRRKEEPIYDVPKSRPKSSIFDESLSMKRRNVPINTLAPFSHSGYPVFSNFQDDEQPHYATVKPRFTRSHVSYENLNRNISLTLDDVHQDQPRSGVSKKSSYSSFADLTANESFVVTMYV